jgi:hypothetical protein
MAPPLTGKSLILHPQTEGDGSLKRILCATRSQVNDGPVTTYEVGQSFSELPGHRHRVSANASETKPAKLLAVFVVDTNETELTTPFGN